VSFQYGQSQSIDQVLKSRRNGFYVECGAVDGEAFSNSLFFELERNWTGLLVEANLAFYEQLLTKNRQVKQLDITKISIQVKSTYTDITTVILNKDVSSYWGCEELAGIQKFKI
jgi:hypothetical protein